MPPIPLEVQCPKDEHTLAMPIGLADSAIVGAETGALLLDDRAAMEPCVKMDAPEV